MPERKHEGRIVKLLVELKQRMQAPTWRFTLQGAAETEGRTNKGEESSSTRTADEDDGRSSRAEGNIAMNRLDACPRVKLTVKHLNQNEQLITSAHSKSPG